VNAFIDMPLGTDIDVTDNMTRQVEAWKNIETLRERRKSNKKRSIIGHSRC